MSHYAIVLKPSEEVSKFIKKQKAKLIDHIGPFLADHSKAHITFLLFKGGDLTKAKWERTVNDFQNKLPETSLVFDTIGTFSNGTIFYKPNDETAAFLKSEVKRMSSLAPASYYGRSLVPHLTITRKLNKKQLATAFEIIDKPQIDFPYKKLSLWKFNGFSWEE